MAFFPVNTMFDVFDVVRTRFFQGLENELNHVRQHVIQPVIQPVTHPVTETFKSKQASYREHRLRNGTIVSESIQTKVSNNTTTTVTIQCVGDRELKIINTQKLGEQPTTERFIKNMTPEEVPHFLTDFAIEPYEEQHPQPDGWLKLEQ